MQTAKIHGQIWSGVLEQKTEMDRRKITAHAGAQVFTGCAVTEAVLAVKCEQEN